MTSLSTLRNVLRKIHRDERGAVSLETILIVGAIALPILIFLLKFAWPKIKQYFGDGMNEMNDESGKVKNTGF